MKIYVVQLPFKLIGDNSFIQGEMKAFTALKPACEYAQLSYSTVSKAFARGLLSYCETNKIGRHYTMTGITACELEKQSARADNFTATLRE